MFENSGNNKDVYSGILVDGSVTEGLAAFNADMVPLATGAAATRRALRQFLSARGVDPISAADVETIAAELLTNAVRHGSPLPSGTIEVSCSITGNVLRFQVTDGGGGTPKILPLSSTSTGGRGLRIVDALSSDWGYANNETTLLVWAKMELPER